MRTRTIALVALGVILAGTLVAAAAKEAPLSGYVVVTQTRTVDTNASGGYPVNFAVTCPAGKKPLSAGFKVNAHQPFPAGYSTPILEMGRINLDGGDAFYPDGSTWQAHLTFAEWARATSPQGFAPVPTDVTLYVTCAATT